MFCACNCSMAMSWSLTRFRNGQANRRTAQAGAQRRSTCRVMNTSVWSAECGVKCRSIRTRLPLAYAYSSRALPGAAKCARSALRRDSNRRYSNPDCEGMPR
ncbi:hypothetical protein D3C72_1955420 [compost metagenome]